MTTEQIEMTRVIAEYDGWIKREYQPVHERELYENNHSTRWLDSFNYLSDLNMLHPVAIKVMGMLNHLYKVSRDRKFMDLAEQIKIACATKPVKGEYLWLFTAVYNGIVFLNEQTVKA